MARRRTYRRKPRRDPVSLLFRVVWWLLCKLAASAWWIVRALAGAVVWWHRWPAVEASDADPAPAPRGKVVDLDEPGPRFTPTEQNFLEQPGLIGAERWAMLVRGMSIAEIHGHRPPCPGAYRHGRLPVDRIPWPTDPDELDPDDVARAEVVGIIWLTEGEAFHLRMPDGSDVYLAIRDLPGLAEAIDEQSARCRNVIWIKPSAAA